MRTFLLLPILTLLLTLGSPAASSAEIVVDWDFTTNTHGWTGNPRVLPLESTQEGLQIQSVGEDPWISSPPVHIPEDRMLRLSIRMKSDAGGKADLFYGSTFSEERRLSFRPGADNQLHTLFIPTPEGRTMRFRIDPSHGRGHAVLRRVRVEALAKPIHPRFAPPSPLPDLQAGLSIQSGDLQLTHHPTRWNALRLRFQDQDLAAGYDGELIGSQRNGQVEFLKLKSGSTSVRKPNPSQLRTSTIWRDADGVTWTVTRTFQTGSTLNCIELVTTIRVDENRSALLLPGFTLLPGFNSFGASKDQGLFAGLEYLADEPSSSKADITGPAHLRKIPDPVNITFPLMAIAQGGRYLGLSWKQSEPVAGGFDSPDRVFGSGAHAFWLSGPPVGPDRFENDLMAHSPVTLTADQPWSMRAQIFAGADPTVVGAVRHYLSLYPLPDLPVFAGGYDQAVELLAHGWLHSAINRDWRFRHAVWQDKFQPTPAADAAMFMSDLALRTPNQPLKNRLTKGSRLALAKLPNRDPFLSSVSHVQLPSPPLVFGRVADHVNARRSRALRELGRFDSQGCLRYRPGKTDYSKTHFEHHANGLGAKLLSDALEAAVLSADPQLINRALELLDQQTDLYADTVPRGAQTWEVPLHTPDILASAHLVRTYVYGYLLTGKQQYLDQARDWAWTGVPFVYLCNPTQGPYGRYATIAVLGATNWKAPVWFGRPVQWCGLVYASALHLLAPYDPEGPWKQLAEGITLTGLQMTWPTEDAERQGLLPDFFELKDQQRAGPAINPGTVGAHLPEAFNRGKLYDLQRLPNGWFLHAPSAIMALEADPDRIQFKLNRAGSYRALLSGVDSAPEQITVNGKPVSAKQVERLLILSLSGPADISIRP